MSNETRLKALKIVLVALGLFYIFGIFLMMKFMPQSWTWEPRQIEYEQMIMGMYATLGVFLLLAAQDPLANRSLIWFTIASNIIHALIMTAQSILDMSETPNLWGDIPALLISAIILWALMPKRESFNA